MNIILATATSEIELELDVDDEQTPLSKVVEAVAPGPVSPTTLLVVDGRVVAATSTVAEAGLVQGSLLSLGTGHLSTIAGKQPVAQVRITAGVVAGEQFLLEAGTYLIGRGPQATIRLGAETVSRTHAKLRVHQDGSATITDLESHNGTTIAGVAVGERSVVPYGQPVMVGAVRLELSRVQAGDRPALGPPRRSGTKVFNRPPRRVLPPAPVPITVPKAPSPPSPGTRFGWAALLAPLAIGLVMAGLWSPMAAVFALLSPVMVIANWVEDRRRIRREQREGTQELSKQLAEFASALDQARTAEISRRQIVYPDVAQAIHRALGPTSRLWERRLTHGDFLHLALGVGDVAWEPPVLGESASELPPEAGRVLDEHRTLYQTTVPLDLSPGRVVGVIGTRGPALAVVRSLLCQAVTLHGPADLRVAVVVEPGRSADWDWVKWLPHTRCANDSSGRRLLAQTTPEAEAVVRELTPENNPGASPSFLGADKPVSGPVTLVVCDGEQWSAGRNSPVRALLAGDTGLVAGIVLAPTAEQLPAVCTSVLDLQGPHGSATYTEPEAGLELDQLLIAGVPEPVARRCARALASLEDPEITAGAAELPAAVSLLRLLDLVEPSVEAIVLRWKASTDMAAPIGVLEGGLFVVDLVRDGPHGLIAGTTGSGKSELLRSLVASLAATIDSEHLNFVLIDYKGGSAFDECARLPHTVGLVTDLDERLGERALRCLEAELSYRERRLRAAGATDLPAYLAMGPQEPLPRLLVVIDEFATMAKELPEFMDSLVGIAQRGRSLGVHLLLATQRPSGAVNDNIRANTNLRIALRVQDSGDSIDVIGTAQAASIGRGHPGRGYLKLGPGEIEPFQAALVTGRTSPGRQHQVSARPFVFANNTEHSPVPSDDDTGPTDLVCLVEAIREAAASQGLREPRRPWPEPLPARITLDELTSGGLPTEPATGCWWAPLGLVDEPDEQRQRVFIWDSAKGNLLIYGVAGAGATTALATIAVSLARTLPVDQVHLYVIDFATQALSPLTELAHVGAVIGAGERERQERLLRWLHSELATRRRRVADGGTDALADLPAIIILLDNYAGFASAFEDVASYAYLEQLHRVIADGPGLGIFTILAADRVGAVPMAVSSLVPEKLVLRLADTGEYAVLGLRATGVAKLSPGSGIDLATGRQVQLALPALAGIADAVAAVPSPALPASRPPTPIGVLPTDVVLTDVLATTQITPGEWFIPLGIGNTSLQPVGFRLGEGDHALVAGPPRSGKSTTLQAILATVQTHAPEVEVTAVALRRSPLRTAPGVTRLVTHADELAAALDTAGHSGAPQLILLDDADSIEDSGGVITGLIKHNRADLHVIAAGRADALRSLYGHWTSEIRRSRQGLILRPHIEMDGDLWQTILPRYGPTLFDPGRGYLIADGSAELLQAARPQQANQPLPMNT
jgi:DNA segregation ATPase FtsK/SpoIIIE, S-DNA-T family